MKTLSSFQSHFFSTYQNSIFMGKASSTRKLEHFARFMNATDTKKNPFNPTRSKARPVLSPNPVDAHRMESEAAAESSGRRPLAEQVSDCVSRWFHDTLKEAKAGDTGMQVLVGQMYYSGYGVVRDAQKGRAWINRASKSRSSVWKVGDKHPGYNASDSDSDEVKEDAK